MEEDNAQGERPARSPLRLILVVSVVVILPVVLGLYFAPRLIHRPKVGLIRLNNDIEAETAYEVTQQLAYARQAPDVRAVVLVINSPGGSAAYSEELYLDILQTRQVMPVVATADLLAASGAYYAAAAADEIYAKPTSTVGSVGVVAFLPGPAFIEEDLLTTGPYKAFGGTRDSMMRQIEMAKLSFLQAVGAGRGDRLKIEPSVLSRAEVFSGVKAQQLGLVDGLSSTEGAVQRAAELAGVRVFDVVELYPLAFPDFQTGEGEVSYRPPSPDLATLWTAPSDLPAGLYYRYIQPPAR